MNNEDESMRASLRESQRRFDGPAPNFETIFGAAERQSRNRRKVRFVSLAAVVAVAVLALSLLPTQEDEFTYVDVTELVATTQWSAPSDSLLPVHQFDIYRELPRLFESTDMSTNIDEGALL